jgi:hypothetical protein
MKQDKPMSANSNPLPSAADVDRWLKRRAAAEEQPSTDAVLALLLGDLPLPRARQVREQIRHSPLAIQEYALITGISITEAQKQLAVEPSVSGMLEGLVGSTYETIRQFARLISQPNPAEAQRGEHRDRSTEEITDSETLLFRADELPPATVGVTISKAAPQRYQVRGSITFDDVSNLATGHFVLSVQSEAHLSGEVDEGDFDLGSLTPGQYRLEIVIESRVIEVKPLNIGL